MMSLEDKMERATILLEALPYIRKFSGKTVVIKYGGSIMINDDLKHQFARDIALLKYVGLNPIIVHGGGKEITKWMDKLGKEAEFIDGLRVTDSETLEITEMVLVGKINSEIVSLINREGMDVSETFTGEWSSDEWHYLAFDGTVPEGASTVQVGAMLVQPTGDDHGSVYMDDFYMHLPLTTTGLFVTHGALADAAVENGVTNLTWTWDVWSSDGFEFTPSSSGERTIHVDVSEMLGIDGLSLPTEFALHNNYPNPFNPVTNIIYDIPEVTDVTLEIYNVMGQRVRTLAQGSHEPGRYQIVWNATNDFGQGLSSGMYIYRIQAGDFVSVKKLVLMK